MSLDVMKQALEALEMVTVDAKTTPNAYEASRQAITALRAAIEQAQEPVAWVCYGSASDEKHTVDYQQEDIDAIPVGTMLYTAPRQWQGLTADEIWQCNAAPPESAVEYHICMAHQNVLDFAEAIEAKLREKNNAG